MKAIPACVLILCAVLTWHRAEIWRTPESLWQDAAVKSPRRPRPHMNLGAIAMESGQYETAMREYQTAELLSLEPGVPARERETAALLTAMNISDILIRTGHIEEAHAILKQGWIAEPGFPGYAVNLSWFYLHGKEPSKAAFILTSGIEHLPEYDWFPKKGSLYVNRAIAWQMMGYCDAAAADYATARQYFEKVKEMECAGKLD